MKRYLSLILRLLVAALGTGYIAYTLTWTDHILLPGGSWPTVAAGQPHSLTLDEPTRCPIVERAEGAEAWTISVPQANGEFIDVQLDTSLLGQSDEQPRWNPSIFTIFAEADWPLLVVGLLLIGAMFPLQALRWLMLLRCRGLEVSPGKAFSLTMVGIFFNFSMPGMTGGDVVKAYYAAKGSGKRGIAVMSIVFDRATGMVGLILFAGFSGLCMLGLTRFYQLTDKQIDLARDVTLWIWGGFGALVVVSLVYFSPRIRELLGTGWLLSRLPGGNLLGQIDQTATAYLHHKSAVLGAILISLPIHLAQAVAVALAGKALGMELSLGLLVTVLPVLYLAGALPISYQGLGVMEGLGMALLLDPPHATANQVVGMLLLMRLFFIVYALLGSLLVLRGNIHFFPPQEVES